MSLRSRLTTAFLVVVLGPVLVGAVFVAAIMSHLADSRGEAAADSAVTVVDSTLGTICERIQASAAAVALNHGSGGRDGGADMAELLVDRAVVDGIAFTGIDDAAGHATSVGDPAPEGAWADCGAEAIRAGARPVVALGAQAEVRNDDGSTAAFTAFRVVDQAFLASLADAADASLVLDDGRFEPLEARGADPAVWARTDAFLPLRIGTVSTDVTPMYWTLAAMVAASGVLAVALASWLARSTTRPLAELSGAAQRISEGDLDVRVQVQGGDEFAQLADNFNRMTAQTQSYVQALTTSRDQMRGQLGWLGQTLTATLDLDRILEVILDTAMVTTSAEAGLVMLADVADTDRLGQRAAEGALGIDEPASVRLGEGVIGGIAASGAPAHGRIVDGRLGPWRRVATEPDARTIVAVPFSSRQTPEPEHPGARRGGASEDEAGRGQHCVLGVLVLYNRVADLDFEDGDVETLKTFAGQVAVAVENVLLHRRAQRLSLTDPLTGLWNYRFMQTSLRREAERVRRYRRSSALLAIDLDRFKIVNDTYGHPIGDQVLVELARRITGQIREVDLAFRHGGEEFMVLLPETDASGATAVAERLARALASRPFKVGGLELSVTVSVGIAVLGEHADTAADVLAAADEALYAAKAAGRDTWRVAAT
ncbi:sensor domain-containing diguanylate cyclase [Glycomyces xiaoerkulensis]|uniref:sensor domain-containing diguanylate cyclase n=1 Tax=Glycomyces xiaoerkulensis TaxID=2038139 RepID=UPI000C265C2A|nr:diguanylate cyclase [Glycomyces xiaoerkulensis]